MQRKNIFKVGVGLFVAVVCIAALVFNKGSLSLDDKDGEEYENDNPGEFFKFQQGIRKKPNELFSKYPSGYLVNEIKKAYKRNRSNSSLRTSSSVFTERGPTNVPGRITAVLNLPGDPNQSTWLAGAATGGVWKTTDGGNSWVEKSGNLPALPVSSFSISNDGIIYAGTGEYVSTFIFSAIGCGILKSVDNGETWTSLTATASNSDFSIVTGLAVDPNNSDVIVATCVQSNTNQKDFSSNILKSVDGGQTWSKVQTVQGSFDQVIATPNDFNILYAAQNAVGLWKSLDAGDTWTLANSGMFPDGKCTIAISPSNTNYIYVSSEGSLTGSGSDLYLSKDAGVTWNLVDVQLSGSSLDFLGGQGFYDNVAICDPFNSNIAYFGGVNLFQTKLNGGTSTLDNYAFQENNTSSFLYLLSYNGIAYDHGRLTVGPNNAKTTVEVRFGPGVGQKAHRFLVPVGATSGVAASSYSYKDYVDVPFEVWDVTTQPERQLMVSFRDQSRNGKFDLLHRYPVTDEDTDPLLNSREYIFINNVTYDSVAPNSNITIDGGQNYRLAYSFFPALAPDTSSVDYTVLPISKLIIEYRAITKFSSSTQTVADAYGWWDGKNHRNETDLSQGVHPDHHALIPVIIDPNAKTYKLLVGNDGGVFVTKVSTVPGTTNGDFVFCGNTLTTGQFYSASKSPIAQRYIGGMQDNGTRISPIVGASVSNFSLAIGGDGFETLWNNRKEKELLGSAYFNYVFKSSDGGSTWTDRSGGLAGSGDGTLSPFYTKLSNSIDFPDRVFAVGRDGVFVSKDFGGTWSLTPIPSGFANKTAFLDVEVSRANANIVWAGSGMFNDLANLFVSTDGGKKFNPVNNFSDMGYITKLASHPTEPSTAYAIFSLAGSAKILRTTDLGQSWEDITSFNNGVSTNGFPDVAVFCVYVHADDPNVIWAGTEIGIVESLDNGQSWALIPSNQFPHVSVFDMKPSGTEVVIATNGRGIWTTDTGSNQDLKNPPTITNYGTSPNMSLALTINLPQSYDSVDVFVDNKQVGRVLDLQNTNLFNAFVANVSKGKHVSYAVGYTQGAPVQSKTYSVERLDILLPQDVYANFFKDLNGTFSPGFQLQILRPEKSCVGSKHNYDLSSTSSLEFLTPIKVASTYSQIRYSDLVIAAYANGRDSVVLEASKDGLVWKTLTTYSSDSQQSWQSAVDNNSSPDPSLYKTHILDLKDFFNPNDLILIRYRFESDDKNVSWGVSLDYIFIQGNITGVEPSESNQLSLYPNPTTGLFNIKYSSYPTQNGPSAIEVYDQSGHLILKRNILNKGSELIEEIDLSNYPPGGYIVVYTEGAEKLVSKVIVVRN